MRRLCRPGSDTPSRRGSHQRTSRRCSHPQSRAKRPSRPVRSGGSAATPPRDQGPACSKTCCLPRHSPAPVRCCQAPSPAARRSPRVRPQWPRCPRCPCTAPPPARRGRQAAPLPPPHPAARPCPAGDAALQIASFRCGFSFRVRSDVKSGGACAAARGIIPCPPRQAATGSQSTNRSCADGPPRKPESPPGSAPARRRTTAPTRAGRRRRR